MPQRWHVADSRRRNDEPVAAYTRHHVMRGYGRGQARTDLGQELVTDRVSQRILDVLEPVEVQ